MSSKNKVIITCAVTGSIHTPSMSPHLPVTAAEIALAAIGAAEAGAAIVHLHARNPQTGEPDQNPGLFKPFLQEIKAKSDVVLNITTGGSQTMSIADRLRPAVEFEPELASLNMGTMNFGLYPMLGRYKDLQGWERNYLEGSRSGFFRNTFSDIENILSSCREAGTRFEVECYDIGHLYTLAHFIDRKLIEPPFFVQSVFGILGGIGGHPEDVAHMKRTADRLFGDQYIWSVLGAGTLQMRIATSSALVGGNVRVGLEDSLWLSKGRLAQSNAEQVRAIRLTLESMGLQIASPAEARETLCLKGSQNTKI
ncbi:3-keto-5-aminohexanoate cleavage protein [Polaromonas hydrogenivorans]|uniref:3-keto-5-aminohexanoate cleavage protein n=1 Tax=Polaromonas hydrogenivorans TaxID=335476 RepID=A0AAU7M256_9BURK